MGQVAPAQRRERRHAPGHPLRREGLDRGDPVDPVRPEARAEAVDEPAHVGIRRMAGGDAVGLGLRLAERLGPAGEQHHLLDAEARIDGLQPLVEQARQVMMLPGRPGGADPEAGALLVDAPQDQVEAAHALGAHRELAAEILREPADDLPEILDPADRFGEREGREGGLPRDQRIDRLEGVAHGLIEPQGRVLAEAPDHRRAGHGGELADPLDAETMEGAQGIGREPQGPDRQGRDGIDGPTRRNDAAWAVARHGPGGAGGVGHRGDGGDALPIETPREVPEQLLLAAEEMRDARDVDPEAVGRIGCHHRRVADGPARQLAQSRLVLTGGRLEDMQLRRQGLRLGQGHAGVKSLRLRRPAGGPDEAAGPHDMRGHEGLTRRWLAVAAPDPIGRPGRQVE